MFFLLLKILFNIYKENNGTISFYEEIIWVFFLACVNKNIKDKWTNKTK